VSIPPRGRVLVAEDNSVNQRVAVRMLEKRGYRADVAANGHEAVQALLRAPYDLVLMDCHMPEMDGYEATRAIRRHERAGETASPRTHIVAMTANALPGDEERCLQAGMDDYLSKPIDTARLDALLERGARHSTPPAEDDVLDRAVLDALRALHEEGEPDLLTELIDLFLTDTPPHLAALRTALHGGDAVVAAREAHRLKGSSREMGLKQLAPLCAALEERARSSTLEGADALMRMLDAEFARARVALEDLRDRVPIPQ
jgi:CheY-like chemotaxis protein